MKTHKCPTCGALMLFDCNDSGFSLTTEIAKWIEGLELIGRSYSYVSNLRQRSRDYLVPFFRNIDVAAIRTFHVHELHKTLLKKKLSSKTVKHVLDALRGFMYHCLQLEMIERMPMFPKVKIEYKDKAWISESTQALILQDIACEHKLPFEVLFETGIRPGEVRALKKKDLKDCGAVVDRAFDEKGFLKSTKTGKQEFKPLSEGLYKKLLEHSRFILPEAFLFPWAKSRNKLSDVWRSARGRHGLKIPLYQASRHSRASQKRQELETTSREELRKVLNHTHVQTTLKHYALDAGREVKA